MKNFESFLLVGTYTGGKGKGIYLYGIKDGDNPQLLDVCPVENPSYFIPSKHFPDTIYAVSENSDKPAFLTGVRFDRQHGKLKITERKQTHGSAPCYISEHPQMPVLVTADYGSGSLTVFRTDGEGLPLTSTEFIQYHGKGKDPERQEGPHIHCANFSPDEKYLFVNDLGTDKVHCYKIDPANEEGNFIILNSETVTDTEPGSGPRHIIFDSTGRHAYLVCELSGAVIMFDYHQGHLERRQSVQTDPVHPSGAAHIALSPDERFLYVSNRIGNDGIAVFSVDPKSGILNKTGYFPTSRHPRHFIISQDGGQMWVACKDSNMVELYNIDSEDGSLSKTAMTLELPEPVFILAL